MAPVVALVDVVAMAETFPARDQFFRVFTKITDGGLPAAGVTAYLYTWTTSPGTPNHGTGLPGVTDADGIIVFAATGSVSGSSSITGIGYSVTFTSGTAGGAAPDVSFVMPAAGGVNNPDAAATYFASAPLLAGTPGDTEVEWGWSSPAPYETRIPVTYGIDVSTGTPATNPTNDNITGLSFLSTGLTNGTTYNARVKGYLSRSGSPPPSASSNIASAVPAVPASEVAVAVVGARGHRT